MERNDLIHTALIYGLSAATVTDLLLMVFVYLRGQSIAAIETTDRVQSVILAAYSVQNSAIIMILLNSAILAMAFLALFMKLKSWEIDGEDE